MSFLAVIFLRLIQPISVKDTTLNETSTGWCAHTRQPPCCTAFRSFHLFGSEWFLLWESCIQVTLHCLNITCLYALRGFDDWCLYQHQNLLPSVCNFPLTHRRVDL